MIKNNLIGQILIALLVLFLLISSIQMFGWGRTVDKVLVSSDNAEEIPAVPKSNKQNKEEEHDFKQLITQITTRPMFSNTRTPFVEEESKIDEPTKEDLVINELKAQLTSVVLTPEQSYAVILDMLTKQRNSYKVGMPLEGEQGGWTLNSIQSRKVVFVSDDNKTQELELTVYGGTSAKNSKGKHKGNNAKNRSKALNAKDKKKNADDIRKKIAERRAQMRAEAAKKK